MNYGLIIPLLSSPANGWLAIRSANLSVKQVYFRHVIPLALITPISGYIGATEVGWPIAGADKLFMTPYSAFRIALLSYIAILVTIFMIGKMVQWMGQTYDAEQPLSRCISLSAYCITPLLMTGFAMLYPPLWFIYLVGLPALGYSVLLLYTGVPIMMEVSKDRGFLFSSAILTLGLISLVGLLAVTVSMWSFGLGPNYGY